MDLTPGLLFVNFALTYVNLVGAKSVLNVNNGENEVVCRTKEDYLTQLACCKVSSHTSLIYSDRPWFTSCGICGARFEVFVDMESATPLATTPSFSQRKERQKKLMKCQTTCLSQQTSSGMAFWISLKFLKVKCVSMSRTCSRKMVLIGTHI